MYKALGTPGNPMKPRRNYPNLLDTYTYTTNMPEVPKNYLFIAYILIYPDPVINTILLLLYIV